MQEEVDCGRGKSKTGKKGKVISKLRLLNTFEHAEEELTDLKKQIQELQEQIGAQHEILEKLAKDPLNLENSSVIFIQLTEHSNLKTIQEVFEQLGIYLKHHPETNRIEFQKALQIMIDRSLIQTVKRDQIISTYNKLLEGRK